MEAPDSSEIYNILINNLQKDLEDFCQKLKEYGHECVVLTVNFKTKSSSYGGTKIGLQFLKTKFEIIQQFFQYCNDQRFNAETEDNSITCDRSLQTSVNPSKLECYTVNFSTQAEHYRYVTDPYKDSNTACDVKGDVYKLDLDSQFHVCPIKTLQEENVYGDNGEIVTKHDDLSTLVDKDLNGIDIIYTENVEFISSHVPETYPYKESEKDDLIKFEQPTSLEILEGDKDLETLCGNDMPPSTEKLRDIAVSSTKCYSDSCKKSTKSTPKNRRKFCFTYRKSKRNVRKNQSVKDNVIDMKNAKNVENEPKQEGNKLKVNKNGKKIRSKRGKKSKIRQSRKTQHENFKPITLNHSRSREKSIIRNNKKTLQDNSMSMDVEYPYHKIYDYNFKERTESTEKIIHEKPQSVEEFQCDSCSKVYKTKSYLKKHKLIHVDCRCYECEECKCKFKTVDSLIAHKRGVHQKKWQRICEICGEMICNISALAHHRLSKHTGEKNNMCHICGKRFFTKSGCKGHMKVHSDEKNYECKLCGKKYKWLSKLTIHEKYIHTGLKPFICKFCGKAFNRSDNLKVHENSHTKKTDSLTAEVILS